MSHYSPITSALAEEVARLADKLRGDAEEFKEMYRRLCVHWGGENWQKSQFERIFRHVRNEIIPIMVSRGVEKQFARSFCSGAENCLITGAPFKFRSKSPEALYTAKKIVDADRTDVSVTKKWEAALSKVAKDKRDEKARREVETGQRSAVHNSLLDLPHPNPGEDPVAFRLRYLNNLIAFSESGAVAAFLDGEDETANAVQDIAERARKAVQRHDKVKFGPAIRARKSA